jgi:hypothetical protein
MRRSQTGTRSTFGGARTSVRTVTAPWGDPIAKRSARRGRNSAVRTRGSSTAKPTPSPQLWGMKYNRNDPAAWPLEDPQTRADLRLDSAMTQAKADWNNTVVNYSFQRGGYAG